MASVGRTVKQVASSAFFVNLGDIRPFLLVNYGASVDTPFLSTSSNFVGQTGLASTFSTVLSTAGRAFLRDMGHNLVSANRTFRKVQLLAPNNAGVSTGGVGGPASSAVSGDYLTAYIELPGTQGNVSGSAGGYGATTTIPPAPVARVG
jgi:hypothetical protein